MIVRLRVDLTGEAGSLVLERHLDAAQLQQALTPAAFLRIALGHLVDEFLEESGDKVLRFIDAERRACDAKRVYEEAKRAADLAYDRLRAEAKNVREAARLK